MTMKWLEGSVKIKKGLSWGQPWGKGILSQDDALKLNALNEGQLQTKILAYWPDQSVKWTGHAAVFEKDEPLSVLSSVETEEKPINIAEEKYNGIYIKNGVLDAFIAKHGEGLNLLDWIKMNGQKKILNLRLFADSEDKRYWSKVTAIKLEENGPVKAVVKISGDIVADNRVIQHFDLRLRFYRDVQHVEIVHTITLVEAVELKGIGLLFKTVIEGENWNRHIHLAGEDGIYTEPAQLLVSRRHAVNNQLYQQQLMGQMVDKSANDTELFRHAEENAIWTRYHLSQLRSDHYDITKATGADYTNLQIGSGKRSKGFMYVGGRNGGVSCGIEKFWEKAPRSITIDGLTANETEVTAWLWSPEGGSMDFRHYSERDHMLSAYEGMEEIRSTPVGIANTNTILLSLFDKPPVKEDLDALSKELEKPARIVSEAEDYYHTKVFGQWSLPDKTTPIKAFLEEQMLFLRQFYLKEIEQRDWFGFWNYGDVMHTYDPYRHTWRYDLGGYAWQNTELVPNMWLWQDFLRTGDAEVFYLAEAMTRHTSEVDQYHLGEYKGLGSRHNVLHWGCQCKEVRISMAGLHKYYYFITADERLGDLLSDVKDNDQIAFDGLAPLREFYPEKVDGQYPIRVGPDWAALTSNWFTEWERTGNTRYRDYILTGINSIKETKHRLLSGPTYLYDKQTKELNYYGTGNVGGYHMIISFGAPQVWLELADSIENQTWADMLAEFGRFYALEDEEKRLETDGVLYDQHFAWPVFATGLMAYAAKHYDDERLAKKAWDILLTPEISGVPLPMQETLRTVNTWKKVEELPWISTNIASQWCLNVILCLEFIGTHLSKN